MFKHLQFLLFLFVSLISMKTNNTIPQTIVSFDTKSTLYSQKEIINLKCNQDHFNYQKHLPPQKNISSYSQSYHHNTKKTIRKNQTQNYQNQIDSASLPKGSFIKQQLQKSTIYFPNYQHTKLPSLSISSTYNRSFCDKKNEKIEKAKQKQGFFIKMPWIQNPASNYKKSFEMPINQDSQSLQKGKALQDHIRIIKTPFKALSNYKQFFNKPFNKGEINKNSLQCIKSKDHLRGIDFPLKGRSEYRSKFENNQNSQNQLNSKFVQLKRKGKFLPEKKYKNRNQQQNKENQTNRIFKLEENLSFSFEQANPLQITVG